MRQIDHTPQIAFVQTVDDYLLGAYKARATHDNFIALRLPCPDYAEIRIIAEPENDVPFLKGKEICYISHSF